MNEPDGDDSSSLGDGSDEDGSSSLGDNSSSFGDGSSLDENVGGGGGGGDCACERALACCASSISMILRAKSSSRVGLLFLPLHFLQCLLTKHLHLMNSE